MLDVSWSQRAEIRNVKTGCAKSHHCPLLNGYKFCVPFYSFNLSVMAVVIFIATITFLFSATLLHFYWLFLCCRAATRQWIFTNLLLCSFLLYHVLRKLYVLLQCIVITTVPCKQLASENLNELRSVVGCWICWINKGADGYRNLECVFFTSF
jgi:hypothetical protein